MYDAFCNKDFTIFSKAQTRSKVNICFLNFLGLAYHILPYLT